MNRDKPNQNYSSLNHSQSIALLERTNSFLTEKPEAELYRELIETLNLFKERLESTTRPNVKIVSPSKVLALELQRQNEDNEMLRSLYQFTVVSPISKIQPILHHCDLICLLYDSSQKMVGHHQKLIERATIAEIPLFLLVNRGKSDTEDYTDWLCAQDYSFDGLILPLKDFIELNNRQQAEFYQQSLADSYSAIGDRYSTRLNRAIKQEIIDFYRQQIAKEWQEINQIKSIYFAEQTLFYYQQQFRKTINDNNQFRLQQAKEIKQAINHAKADLINPFSVDSLIFQIQQIIGSAKTKIIKKPEHIYLYLVLEDLPNTPLLHDYIWNLCQQKAEAILDREWTKVRVGELGGLEAITNRTNEDLNSISLLLDNRELTSIALFKPSLNMNTIIDYDALEFNSRIIFDYSYLQSSWFRLLISIAIGIAIYLFTLFFFGAGRYFGFLIIIFQVINLITGQSIKKFRLKQQTKELKRIVDQRYQSLVRIIVNQIAQVLILAVDSEVGRDRERWCESIAIAQKKLDELKQTSDRHKSRIDSLKETRSTIQSWFD